MSLLRKQKIAITKHPNAIHGVILDNPIRQHKRVRSAEQDFKAPKRDKKEPEQNQHCAEAPPTNMAMTKETFINFFQAALQSEQVKQNIKSIFANSISDIEERIDNIDFQNEARDDEIQMLKKRVDSLDQSDRNRNLILTGMKIDPPTADNTAKKLKHLLRVEVDRSDINYIAVLAEDPQPKIKIALYNKQMKDTIFAAKKKLKGKKIYLSDDLTVENAKIYYHSRQAVKKGTADATWTSDGRIIVKKTPESKPFRVTDITQLHRLLGTKPLLSEDLDAVLSDSSNE